MKKHFHSVSPWEKVPANTTFTLLVDTKKVLLSVFYCCLTTQPKIKQLNWLFCIILVGQTVPLLVSLGFSYAVASSWRSNWARKSKMTLLTCLVVDADCQLRCLTSLFSRLDWLPYITVLGQHSKRATRSFEAHMSFLQRAMHIVWEEFVAFD